MKSTWGMLPSFRRLCSRPPLFRCAFCPHLKVVPYRLLSHAKRISLPRGVPPQSPLLSFFLAGSESSGWYNLRILTHDAYYARPYGPGRGSVWPISCPLQNQSCPLEQYCGGATCHWQGTHQRASDVPWVLTVVCERSTSVIIEVSLIFLTRNRWNVISLILRAFLKDPLSNSNAWKLGKGGKSFN